MSMTLQELTSVEQAAPLQVVRTAINIVSAYHEEQIDAFTSMLNGNNPEQLDVLTRQFEQFLDVNESPETAFVAFLQFISQY